MKKVFLILTVVALCLAFAQPSFAKGTEKTEEAGSWIFMTAPVWVGIISTATEVIGAPEIVFAIAIAYGAYKTHIGDWGKDGTEAIKECAGTHTNGNCYHMELNKAELLGGNVGHN